MNEFICVSSTGSLLCSCVVHIEWNEILRTIDVSPDIFHTYGLYEVFVCTTIYVFIHINVREK